MQTVARLVGDVQGQRLFSCIGAGNQHHARCASVVGNGHHSFGMPAPRHVKHNAVHLAIAQDEPRIGGKA
ncbi:hypothetical protein D3C76_1672640 [compost metagenome]